MVAGLPDQLLEAYAGAADVIEEAGGEVGGIAVAGMGGSAIGGDLVSNVYDVSLPSAMVTVRNYHLPHWLDSRSLVFAVSYSGNTEETLACLDEALERGCRTVCICSGGRLAAVAEERGLPLVKVPAGLQPRAALGYLSVPIAACLEHLGLVESVEADLQEAAALLRKLVLRLGPDVPAAENTAKQTALALAGSVPVIYGCELTAVAARRWKCQINENAKMLAFANEFPELDHNELVGWENPPAALEMARVVYLEDAGVHPQNQRRMDITADTLEAAGVQVTRLATEGESRLARLMSSIIIGDYVSLYLSVLGGIDPSPVERIEELKRRLA